MNRRKFLGQLGCAALGYTTLYSSLINLKAMNAAALADSTTAAANDYKALVCILLSGGNDAYNMLIPTSQDQYAIYQRTRSNLAIPIQNIHQLNSPHLHSGHYGIHPGMPEVKNLFDQEKLAFVANVGTLVEPTSKQQFFSGSHPLPLGLLSHADQIQQWQTGMPHDRSATGWGGRVAELVQSMNSNQKISMNISLSETNVFQQGREIFEYAITPDGALGLYGRNSSWDLEVIQHAALDQMLDKQYQDVFQSTYVNTIKSSIEATEDFQEVMKNAHTFNTGFSNNTISRSLRMIARVISVQQELGFQRQIFFLNFGGWDHHDAVLDNQAAMLPILSQALSQFQMALEEIGKSSEVTTFTISDFARTLTSNGDGTDHAWGGHTMVMGGAVKGGRIYGRYPSLELGNPLDLYNGVMIPTTSADEYFAELAIWFGVSTSQAMELFPYLPNFYNPQSGNQPIGFLNL